MFKISFILLILLLSSVSQARQSCDWPFRTSVTITEQSGNTLTDYLVKLNLTGAGTLHADYKWSNDGRDLRIYDTLDDTQLPFRIETWNSATESAEVWVSFPASAPLIANQDRQVFIYYGNQSTTSQSDPSLPSLSYVDDRIKFHTRSNNNIDPDSLNEAKSLFDSQDDSNDAYGCSHPANFTAVTNHDQDTSRSSNNFVAYSETYFTVGPGEGGWWGVRYGADFGHGGGLYVNGIILEEIWQPASDFWWGGNWNSDYVLDGRIELTPGEHRLEIIGAEGCCDGGVTVEFSKDYPTTTPYTDAVWLPFTSSNIDIRSKACPTIFHTIQYSSSHNTCDVDLSLDSAPAVDSEWFVGSSNEVALQVSYVNSSPTSASANPTTQVEIQLPTEVTLNSFSGSNWSCSTVFNIITCNYSSSLSGISTLSSTLILNTSVSGSATAGDIVNISATVTGNSPDSNLSNNNFSHNIALLSNVGLPAGCSNPKLGMWASYYEITGETEINDANAYDTLITNYKTDDHLLGKTVLTNINGVGNPFDPSLNDFLLVLEGYLYLPTAGEYRFGVDGSDAVQAQIGSTAIVSAYYGDHALRGRRRNVKRINLTSGFHPLEYRAQKNTGSGAYDFYWRQPSDSGFSIIPSSTYYHCAGNADIQLNTEVKVIEDGINALLPKAIPGAEMNIKVTAINNSNISTDLNSTVIIQSIDAGTELFIGNFKSTGGPIHFIDDTNATLLSATRGLSYSPSIDDANNGLSFSTNGVTYLSPDSFSSTDYEPSITHIRLQLDGSMLPIMGATNPSFSFEYQVRVK